MSKAPKNAQAIEGPEESTGFLLWQVAMCWQRNINKVLAPFELTYTQFVVLVVCGWLAKESKNMYQHQVARYAMIDRMMTSRIITSLENKGYVTRSKQLADARTNSVTISEKGSEVLSRSLQAAAAMEKEFFETENAVHSPAFNSYMQELLAQC